MTTPTKTKHQGELGLELVAQMNELTFERMGERVVRNARHNANWRELGRSLRHLRQEAIGEGDSAIVVAAGPSVKRRDPARAIQESHYRGAIIATDSAIYYCLRNGIVPDLVVTVDPQDKIVRWFGDPTLDASQLERLDYFRRQDMDEAFCSDERRANDELLELLDRHGKNMRVAMSTSANPRVVERARDAGMSIYWWNPMMDDPEDPGGLTAQLHRENKLPCVNAGGNVGAACWMMAHAVLGKLQVALTGMDYGYYGDTPYERTQYYHHIRNLVGDSEMDRVFMRIHNQYLDEWFLTDPAYRWYREIFIEMAQEADCVTYNCTEGGILFGESIEFIPLADFLSQQTGESNQI